MLLEAVVALGGLMHQTVLEEVVLVVMVVKETKMVQMVQPTLEAVEVEAAKIGMVVMEPTVL